MYDTILVPTDGSEGSERAVELAIDLATTYDATLHPLHVIDVNMLAIEDEFETILSSLEDSAQEMVDDVVERATNAGVSTTEGFFDLGVPYKVILDYADEHDIDLIVMGTHGRTGLDRYLLGSITEKVVRTSDVPVLTARVPDTES
ncbi:universal stress protein [Haladaptatus sp. NG-WS-4]